MTEKEIRKMIECNPPKVGMVYGNIRPHASIKSVDDVCPTITAHCGNEEGGSIPMIVEKHENDD